MPRLVNLDDKAHFHFATYGDYEMWFIKKELEQKEEPKESEKSQR